MLRSLALVPRTAVRGFVFSASSAAEAKSNEQPSAPSKRDLQELFAEKPQRTHAFSKNRVEIVGGVAADPQLRTGKNERPYTMVNVITNHTARQANGEQIEKTERHSISVFGKQAEYVVGNIKKGTRVVVEGRLHYSGGELQENGERTPRQVHIHASSIQPLARNQNRD